MLSGGASRDFAQGFAHVRNEAGAAQPPVGYGTLGQEAAAQAIVTDSTAHRYSTEVHRAELLKRIVRETDVEDPGGPVYRPRRSLSRGRAPTKRGGRARYCEAFPTL